MTMFSFAHVGSDTVELQAGKSPLEGDVLGQVGAGVTGAVFSGLGSIYNTFASGANALGADVELLDTYKQLENLDGGWADYYKANKNPIDAAGFIATSLIPGTLGIKALNAVRSGQSVGAVGRALGFTQTKQAEYVSKALAEMATEGGTVFTTLNRNKIAAMGWGAADQVLQAAAFETAVALTMKQSPLLADESWWDIGKDALKGAAFGGVIGGGIDALILNKSFKNAVKALDSRAVPLQPLGKLDGLGLDAGDKAFAIADSLLKLPADLPIADNVLNLSFHVGRPDKIVGWNPELKKIQLDVKDLLSNIKTASEKQALLEFETNLRKLATDSDVATPFAEKVLADFAQMRAQGKDPALIREQLGDYLYELKALKPATTEPRVEAGDLWYFKKSLKPEDLKPGMGLEEYTNAVVSSSPFDSNAYKRPYVFIGTAEQRLQAFKEIAIIGREGTDGYPTLSAAWKDGRHIAIEPNGALRVNDASPFWRRVDDPIYSSNRFINTRTGAITGDTVLTAADQVASKAAMTITGAGVKIPTSDGLVKQIAMGAVVPAGKDLDATYWTARHAWASKLTDDQLPKVIDATDSSLMDRLRSVTDENLLQSITIKSGDKILGDADSLSIPEIIRSAKLSESQRILAEAAEKNSTIDVRQLAYQLNVDGQWLENAVASRFRSSMSGDAVIGGKTVDTTTGLSLPLDSYTRRENLIAEYARPQQFRELDVINPQMSWDERRKLIKDSTNVSGGQFVTGDQAWGYRVTQAIRANENAAAAVIGDIAKGQFVPLAQDAAKLADSLGSGASTFGAANADYGDILRLWAQDQGKKTHLWVQNEVSKVMDQLSPVVNGLRTNRKAAAEVGIVTNILRGTDEKYIWDKLNPKRMILRELDGLVGQELDDAVAALESAGKRVSIDLQEDLAATFFRTHTSLNDERIMRRQVLNNAKGTTMGYAPGTIYVPPVDTTYFQHFAFVRPIQGKAFGTSEVAMVFGRDAAELAKRISQIDKQNFEVITKKGTEDWFKAKDLYDFDLTINEPRINSELKKSGALNNVFPEVRAENIGEDFVRWHQNQAGRLIRDAVETHYAQQIADLRGLGNSYTEIATSKFAGSKLRTSSEIVNPFDDYIKSALDISKRSEYTFLHQANEFVDALGTRAYRFLQEAFSDGKKGLIPWSEVEAIGQRYGIKGLYNTEDSYFTANLPRDRNLIKEGVTKANMLLANTVLRLDFFNPLVNIVSTPILLGTELTSIRTALKSSPELLGKLEEALSVKVPGQNSSVPSATKLIGQAIKNFFGDDGKALIARYKANGDIKDTLSQFHSMIDDLALRADFKVFSDKVNKAFETGARITGNEQAEQFTRFITADVMRQLTEPGVQAGKLSLAEQNAFISVFTNRVQGNYISSQRPIVFQGVLGSAVSLFQTYSFNLIQQLLRHVENKDKKAVATLFGMQAGLFGLNGTPFFEAVNTHLIGNAAINQGHYDAYSLAPALLGKEMGDWLMYGTASAMPIIMNGKTPALYTRGDINPRHASILPLNPADIPAVDASVRLVSNLVDVGSKLVNGANLGTTLLQGLEHNGINRPLAGFAQVLSGQATTSKGSLISASSDFDLVANASRLLGSRPMDEAIALNNLYRMKAYQAADTERRNQLGERVKTFLYKNQEVPAEDLEKFQRDYAAAGGRLENFQASIQEWGRAANRSVVENMRAKINSPYGQRLSEIMGGEPLPDYYNQPTGASVPTSEESAQ